jgi:hypothetical protein
MAKPTTIDECMIAFNEILSPEDQIEILKMEEEDLVSLHHGLGRWIRNNWGLWDEIDTSSSNTLLRHMTGMGFQHPDDMSQTLIEEYWARMLNKPSKIQEKIAHYTEFWNQQKKQG